MKTRLCPSSGDGFLCIWRCLDPIIERRKEDERVIGNA